ncbi:MAG: hypothetical protein SFV23_16275 [Planctomycetaceae bacterium]|nr:hypothetical protein [Planctomycetaceae bacterium]
MPAVRRNRSKTSNRDLYVAGSCATIVTNDAAATRRHDFTR